MGLAGARSEGPQAGAGFPRDCLPAYLPLQAAAAYSGPPARPPTWPVRPLVICCSAAWCLGERGVFGSRMTAGRGLGGEGREGWVG